MKLIKFLIWYISDTRERYSRYKVTEMYCDAALKRYKEDKARNTKYFRGVPPYKTLSEIVRDDREYEVSHKDEFPGLVTNMPWLFKTN